MLNPELKDKMQVLYTHMVELERELRIDPSLDARTCRQMISGAIAGIDMKMDSQWGEKLRAAPQAEVSEAPAAPKAKKKNSPV